MRRLLAAVALLTLLAVPCARSAAAPSDVWVAFKEAAGPRTPVGPDTVLHVLGGLAHGWDPVKSGCELDPFPTMVTAHPNALLRMGEGGSPTYFATPTGFYWLAFGPDGRHLLAATDSSSIEVYALGARPVLERTLHVSPPSIITSFHVTPKAAYASCVSGDRTSRIVVMDPNGASVRATWLYPSPEPLFISDLCTSPDGLRLYVAAFGKRGPRGPGHAEVAALDASSGAVLARGATGAEPMGIACGPDGRVLVGSLGTASVTAHDPVDLQTRWRLQVGLRPTRILVDGGRAYVSCSGDDKVYVLDPTAGAVVASVEVDPNPLALARRADGHLLVGCVRGRTVCDVDLETGAVVGRTSRQPFSEPYGIAVRR